MIFKIYSAFFVSLDWIFPPECVGCGIEKEQFCNSCYEKIKFINSDICQICGFPNKSGSICNECSSQKPFYDQLRSVALYTSPISDAIRMLKYRRGITLGFPLSKLLVDKVSAMDWDIDLVVPVPMSPKHYYERGYNQAAVLAFPTSLILDRNYEPKAIVKIRETKTQVGLNAKERKTNVKNAFVADSKIICGKNVLLVDDVTTTGATINACSLALREAGAALIYAITLGKSIFSTSDFELQ